MRPGAVGRVTAVMMKDAAELCTNPGALLPAVWLAIAAVLPGFLVAILAPMIAGESLAESGEFAEGTGLAVTMVPELRRLMATP